jgi:hypothetical protein
MIRVFRFPSFAYGENRLRLTAFRSLLLAIANRKHKVFRFPSFAYGENRLRSTAFRSLLLVITRRVTPAALLRLRRNRTASFSCANRKHKVFRFPAPGFAGRRLRPLAILLVMTLLTACSKPAEPEIDMVALRADIQEKTERMYWIHLRLDTASTEISNAEQAARDGNASAAEFHAAEAYRSIEQADQALLELGTQMQEMAGLDRNRGG